MREEKITADRMATYSDAVFAVSDPNNSRREKVSTNRDLPSIHELDVWCDDDGITVFQSLPHFDSGFRS
jgi:hypothetical protein